MTDALSFTNPAGLYDPAPNGYSHLAEIPAGWRLVIPAGQGGERVDGTLDPDFRRQLTQALDNVRTVLAAAGAAIGDIAKVTLLVVDHDLGKLGVVAEEAARAFGGRKPAMTLIPVPRLALDGMLVEIDVVAALPPGRAT